MSVRASASPLGVNNNKDLPSTLPSKPSSGSCSSNSGPYVRPSSTSSATSASRISPSAMDGSAHRASTGPGGLSPNSTSNNAMADGSSNRSNSNSRFRASVDAPRNVYGAGAGNGHLSLQPGYGSPNLAANAAGAAAQGASPRPGSASKRPSSEMLASFAAGNMNTESDALDKWFEDLHHYEATLEEMAAASLDQSFKEELGAIEQWFRVLSEAERTAALYSLLQTSSQVQIRFFITVLQQMARSDPMNALLSPANPQQSSMEAQMEAKLASLGLKSPASPAVRNFARQSLGAMPVNDAAGFLSPHSAMLQPPPRSSSSGNNTDGTGNAGSHDSADAATLLAAQRAKLNANAANRISAPGSLLSTYDHNSLRSPLWSQANSEQVAERSGRSPSPDGRSSNASRSRPASMISDQGLPSAANNNSHNNLGGSTAAGNLANNLSPSLGSSTGPANNNASIMSTLENAQLSPLMQGQSWAAMMQTPLMSSFGPNNQANNDGTFPRLDMSTNGNANKQSQLNNWAANSQSSNSNIVLDDAKKFRRTGRANDAGFDGMGMGMQGMRNAGASTGANGSSSNNGNAAAMAAQQNWRNMNSPLAGNTGLPNTAGLASPDLSNLATLQAAMQQLNNANGGAAAMQSPQVAMANLLAAQQQIQQQMQLQQLMAGMSPMAMMNNLQNQQMLSPLLGGLGMGMNMPSSANSSNRDRRSPRPSDRSTFGNSSSGKSNSGAGQNSSGAGSGTNADEPIDINLLSDIPAWLRVLRLHKYTTTFESSHWKDMIMMTNADLENKGVAALGARRKLLKVFENIRNAQGIPHPPGSEVPGGDDAKSEAPENPAWAALHAEVQRDIRLLRGDDQ